MDNRNFNSIIGLISRIRVADTHSLFPQLEAFRVEGNQVIFKLSTTRYEALPRPITEPILPGSKELAKANFESFETMRNNGWVYANPQFDTAVNTKDIDIRETVLINDAYRADTIVFDNQTYAFSPEFRFENLEAVKFFVSRVLPLAFLENEAVPLFLNAWNQKAYSVIETKFQEEVLRLAASIGPNQNKLPFFPMNNNGTTFISYDENGDIFLDVINSNFKVRILGKDIVEKHIPGTTQLRYKFHRNNAHPELSGFQLQWVKLSNSGWGNFIFSSMTPKDYETLKKLITEEKTKEQNAELEQYSLVRSRSSSEVKDALDKLENFLAALKVEEGYPIFEMTTQILQDPFNPALALNYLKLAQDKDIRAAMEGVVSAVRAMYAPHYLKELLPKLLEKLGETLEQPSISNLIALQAFQMKLSLLPGEWGELGKKMKDLLAADAWELIMLKFRLKGNLTGFRAFLVDPEVYKQLLINLNVFAQEKDYQQRDYKVIFANLPKPHANPFTKLKLNENLELKQGLVDSAIYTILEDLVDSNGQLAIDIAAILNAHSPLFIQDINSLNFSYNLDGIIMSYLDNFILSQMDPTYGEKFREAFSKRFQALQDELKDAYKIAHSGEELKDAHLELLLHYKSILSDSIRTVSTPLTKAAERYPKMWKKQVSQPEKDTSNTPEEDKTQQGSKEESTKKPEGRKQ